MVLVIVKALDILELIAQDPTRAHSLTEIAETMQMNQATCVNILKTLVEKNYLEHLGRKKGYRLGPMAYNLTNNLSYSQDLVLVAKDIMEDLTRRINETSILGVLRNQKRFIVHLVNSDQDLQVRSRTERNIYETASGRLLLAFMSAKERESLVNAIGYPGPDIWPGASTSQGLEAELRSIQAQELSVTRSKTHIIGLAVPVRRHNQVIASLSIFLPEIRFSDDRKKEFESELRTAAQLISQRLSALT
ncbi:IclR family transcriptional regulator [Larkinella rosea]|jgi:DNA-binding IclR family transcriptional regulator|uniref:IclR family transcriptional regulator n=1 Tax=Larkinella rosea TaxID=2025312 RepID=A0A3P1BAL2_9BACT|nr:IclR family transcriptional regulator [Larkinella rosea]RRA98078.1 IclR family transcriptional regulator [Larkinella rosea]